MAHENIQTILNEGIIKNIYGGASILVNKGGKEVYYAQAGCQNKQDMTALERDTLFRIYSMSKPITAAAAMILVDRGKLDLLAPVSDFLPGFASQHFIKDGKSCPVTREATVTDLFNMTSGLVYPGDDDPASHAMGEWFDEYEKRYADNKPMDTIAFMNHAGTLPLAFAPGSQWRYGISADVMGAVIEVVSGKSFSRFLQDELFTPLSMNDTSFYVPKEKQARFATVYERDETGDMVPFTKRYLAVGGMYEKQPAFESGGAGLVSTIDDYMTFAQMLLNRGTYQSARILSPAAVQYMTSPGLTDTQTQTFWDTDIGYQYGRLMRVRVSPGLGNSLGNAGEYGWGGWLGTQFFNDPAQGVSFVFMTQRKDTNSAALMFRLKNAIYGTF